eukprot:1343435-Pleurochrysis_carterae.AAC.1
MGMIFMPIPPSGRPLASARAASPETLRRKRVTEVTAKAVANANARRERVKQLVSLHDQVTRPMQHTSKTASKLNKPVGSNTLAKTKLAQGTVKIAKTE